MRPTRTVRSRSRSLSLWALLLLLVGGIVATHTLSAHQDDPKAVYRPQPFGGPGYRTGQPWVPGAPYGPNAGAGTIGAQPMGAGGGTAAGGAFDATGVTLLSWLTLPELGTGLTNASDCWGYTSPTGREYALVNHSAGTTIVEITDPLLPVVITEIAGPTSLWRDVKTYQDHAYIVSEGGSGIQVVDLSGIDGGIATLVTSITAPTATTAATHNVAIDEESGFLYRCGGGSHGLRIYDLANPDAPVYVGAWPDRYVHDVQVVTYTSGPYAGMQVAFACTGLNGGSVDPGLDIIDVTDKANIVTIAHTSYPAGQYSHQAWLSEDRQTLYLNDELDEDGGTVTTKTFIFDVSDLAAPVYSGSFTNGNPAIGHNLYVLGDMIFEANYRSGMRVFDATDPLAPVEIAYFDTFPDNDGTQFNGLWSVYPYFPSGTVIGSDLERGLFVWAIGEPPLIFDYPAGRPVACDPEGGTPVTVDVIENGGAILDPASVALMVDDGSGYVPVPMTSLGGATFTAALPAAACGTTLEYYVTAGTTTGDTATSPLTAPVTHHSVIAQLGEVAVLEDTMETPGAWTVGAPGDTATTGIWVHGDPLGTAAQPEDDHTAVGTECWFTGQGTVGGSLGENDIDGGATTLVSPAMDLTGMVDPIIGYWRWFSNDSGGNPGEDTFEISISGDDGANWVPVETVGPTGPGTGGLWVEHRFRPAELLPLTAAMRLRFVASDSINGSVVEAAVDDLTVVDQICVDCNGNGVDDSLDIAGGASLDVDLDGVPDECAPPCPNPFVRGDVNADGSLDLSDAIATLAYLFVGGATPDPIDRADIDAGGAVNVADAVLVLGYLFQQGPPPAPPFPDPGCP